MISRMVLPICVLSLSISAIAPSKGPITRPGNYNNGTGTCPVRITLSGQGGFRVLHLPSHDGMREVVKDTTAVLFLDDRKIAYSVSPMYGKPGIFVFDCVLKNT